MRHLEWPLNVIQCVLCWLFRQVCRVDKVAVFSVHKHCIIDVVKFDMHRNLQRHRAVVPAIARLSCAILSLALYAVTHKLVSWFPVQQESWAIEKTTTRCALYGCPENVRESLTMPTATFPEIFNVFFSIEHINVRTQFEVHSFTRFWDNRGYSKHWAVLGFAHAPFSPKILMGFCTDGPGECTGQIWSPYSFTRSWDNMGHPKNWAVPGYVQAAFSPNVLMWFCSDGPVIVQVKFEVRSYTHSWDNSDWSLGWGLQTPNIGEE